MTVCADGTTCRTSARRIGGAVEVRHLARVSAVEPIAIERQFGMIRRRSDTAQVETKYARLRLDLGCCHAMLPFILPTRRSDGGTTSWVTGGCHVHVPREDRVQHSDTPKVGVTMGYPASIGVIWHMTDGVALPPRNQHREVVRRVHDDHLVLVRWHTTSNTSVSTTDTWQIGARPQRSHLLVQARRAENVCQPALDVPRGCPRDSSSNLATATGTSGHANFVSGSSRRQYALGRRFSVFGELGWDSAGPSRRPFRA
jgi:hypothetical protein